MPCVCPGCRDVYELNDMVPRTARDDLVCVGCKADWLDVYGADEEEDDRG